MPNGPKQANLILQLPFFFFFFFFFFFAGGGWGSGWVCAQHYQGTYLLDYFGIYTRSSDQRTRIVLITYTESKGLCFLLKHSYTNLSEQWLGSILPVPVVGHKLVKLGSHRDVLVYYSVTTN